MITIVLRTETARTINFRLCPTLGSFIFAAAAARGGVQLLVREKLGVLLRVRGI
jgi:hypothetical protein